MEHGCLWRSVMKFAFMQPNGILAIVHPAPKEAIERVLGSLTDEQYRVHVIERSIPADAQDVRELPDNWQPPTSRLLRDAWRHDSVDMEAARGLWREHMRKVRQPLLQALDIDYQRADESGADAGRKLIAQRKQALRDVTVHPDIESAKTPEELMAVWPEILGE